MKTYNVTMKDTQVKKRYIVDAEGKVLGRLASSICTILRGKHKATYSPAQANGDHVVVINADKVKVTGNKAETMIYRWHTNFPGGLKEVPFGQQHKRHPTFAIEHAVWGMLPHNALGRRLMKNVRIFAGVKHPYASQQLTELKI